MQSKAATVSEYLDALPPERQAALRRLRSACLSAMPDAIEGMTYGMPTYARGGKVEIAFASQKQYIALYVMKAGVVAANNEAFKGLNVGKSCVRFPNPERMDFALIDKLLAESRDSPEAPC